MYEKLGKDRCYIIAEIGGNFLHYEEAVALIDSAVYSGVDCVKMQTFRADTISTRSAYFDMESTGKISQYDYFKKYEISEELHRKVFAYATEKGLDWFSTPSHPEDADMLERLGMRAFKLGADDATNIPFLRYVARKRLPMLISSGMCTMQEVRAAVDAILSEGNDKIVIFHTVSAYPCYSEYVNLNVILSLQKEFPDLFIGYSDHTLTTTAAIAAASMGAAVVERHFTLDKYAEGPDHRISSTPEEMKYIVDTIREIEIMRGTGLKRPVGPEVLNRINNRKSITAIKGIKKGAIITCENVDVKRPGTGISPQYMEQIIGRRATKDIAIDELVLWSDIE